MVAEVSRHICGGLPLPRGPCKQASGSPFLGRKDALNEKRPIFPSSGYPEVKMVLPPDLCFFVNLKKEAASDRVF